jgi:hypothetical protein
VLPLHDILWFITFGRVKLETVFLILVSIIIVPILLLALSGQVTIVDFQARGRLHWESVGKKIVSLPLLLSTIPPLLLLHHHVLSFPTSFTSSCPFHSIYTISLRHYTSHGEIIQGTPFPPKTSTSTSSSSLINYLAPGPETLFDPETDEPSLTGLWDELVGIENSGSGTIPRNGDREDSKSKEENARSRRTTADMHRDKERQAAMERGTILLVGFSELIYQGFSPEYLARFGRAMLGWCRQVSLSSSLLAAACYHEVLPRRTPNFVLTITYHIPLLRYRPKRPS